MAKPFCWFFSMIKWLTGMVTFDWFRTKSAPVEPVMVPEEPVAPIEPVAPVQPVEQRHLQENIAGDLLQNLFNILLDPAPDAAPVNDPQVEPNVAQAMEPLSPTDITSIDFTSVVPFEHRWTIDHISHLFDNNNTYEAICSSTFPANNSFSFYLKLRPNGMNQATANFVSLTLCRSAQERQEADQLFFRLSILDTNGQKRFSKATLRRFEPNGDGWGWHQFAPRQALLNPESGLLPGDKLTILCEAKHIITKKIVNKLAFTSSLAPNPAWMCDLLDNGAHLSDVTLEVDGQSFACHKVVLSAASPVFNTMFQIGMSEQVDNLVEITGIDRGVFRALLKYIYTGVAQDVHLIARELLIAADKFQMDSLKQLCEQSLIKHDMALETASELLQLAKRYSATYLEAAVNNFVKQQLDKSVAAILDDPVRAIETAHYLVGVQMQQQ